MIIRHNAHYMRPHLIKYILDQVRQFNETFIKKKKEKK